MSRRLIVALSLAAAVPVRAETVDIDARAPAAAPVDGYVRLGSARAPDGTVLGVNSRYLTENGKPWLPVMGEVHFVRLPPAEWDEELAKIKASGVDIVATYLFWNYHEETPGTFDFTGDRDVRRFVRLAAAHGLKVLVRLGPWAHGEVRYGGIPDWVVRQVPTRGSDPRYLALVDRYWGAVADELNGLLWKDGGPIVGVQLENEYNLAGDDEGRRHIADLKAIALRHGFDVPYYTVTGWDGAIYPRGQVLPVFGGYPDEPWGLTTAKLPPKETYAFRFDSRVSGNLGATTQAAGGDADPDIPFTPFLGAEFGGGVPTMYRRRPVIAPDDIAAMLPVELGSGVNLYGYYMYHGGRNLVGRTTLEENTAIGGYNDLPMVDYDFQAPFGETGEAAPVLGYLRPFHYFLRSYGAALAPMTPRRPAVVPAALDDLATLRWSARAAGDAAFVFVNNHVRQYAMAAHRDVRFRVALPGGAVTFPVRGVTVAPDAYFIWPVGLDLGGQTLAWASAQPVTRIDTAEGPLHVFMASDGIAPEFAFAAGAAVEGAPSRAVEGRIVATPGVGRGAVMTVRRHGAPAVRILVISQADARRLERVDVAGAPRLFLTDATLAAEGRGLAMTSTGDPTFAFAAWPALPRGVVATPALTTTGQDGLFTTYRAQAKPHAITATMTPLRAPGVAPPVPVGGVAGRAIQPWPESVGRAAGAWTITVPAHALDGIDDAILRIDWAGDIGRLFAGTTLIDDRFYDGRPWRVALGRYRALLDRPLTLSIVPLRGDAPIYLDQPIAPRGAQVARLDRLSILPLYRLVVRLH